ncbi:hypothetical protein DCAR_0832449 [Daucus carota subsp. sativus]|uniref:Uncharacterized protein n=1 Tax=Daucus carota subsp. sativus TaxID=79200 RepID=A0AAF0XS15_DAUCS|nr:hypothetical protein DCAR_0832449 [Daucus carota subsp. sativus]
MLQNLLLLEELEFPYTSIFRKGIQIVGRHCPHLRSSTLNQRTCSYSRSPRCDRQALAIANSMPGLRRLQLIGNRMTSTGLMAILRKCDGLCRILKDKPGLETKLRQQIRHVRFPQDSTEDCEYDTETDISDVYWQ